MNTDERIARRRAELTAQRAERKDIRDLPRTMTEREVDDYVTETRRLDRAREIFETTVSAWAAVPSLEPEQQWIAHLTAWRDTMSDERMAIKSPIRDRALKDRANNLEWSIKLIDYGLSTSTLATIVTLASNRLGELMHEAGYDVDGPGLRGPRGFRGSRDETEARIKALTRQRAAADAALDAVLLTDEERARQEAETQAYRDALNTMTIRNSLALGGDVLRAYHKDTGEPLDVADMTPAQRTAFERMEAAERAYRQSVIDRHLSQRAGDMLVATEQS